MDIHLMVGTITIILLNKFTKYNYNKGSTNRNTFLSRTRTNLSYCWRLSSMKENAICTVVLTAVWRSENEVPLATDIRYLYLQ